ncbi:MAG: hypothetical protein QOI40_1234, partial [Alphaproteobacteria bacterium]|nr:hypothetical protein [Alphaproteobacteria bacterium]
ERMASSRVLEEILDSAPADYFTLGWLTATLEQRSFGIMILFLGLLGTAPVGSTVPGLLLAVLAVQMIAGRGQPIFPEFIATRRLPTRSLRLVGERAIPFLKFLERAIHPRWPVAFEAARRAVGVVILLLTAVLLLFPLPLSNVVPAIVIAVISLAYIEEDGLLLLVALFVAVTLIGLTFAAVWGAVVSAILLTQLW